MRSLPVLLIALESLSFGCASKPFVVNVPREGISEVNVVPERVAVQCEALENGRTGMMIHVLDDANTYLTVIQGNQLEMSECTRRRLKIESLLKAGDRVVLSGFGDLDKPLKAGGWPYAFGLLGSFPSNGRVLQFNLIRNDKGDCFSAHALDEKPCLGD